MDVPDKIKKLSREQLERIVKSRRFTENSQLTAYLSANSKARSACALRHRGWGEEINRFTNATIEVCVKQNMKDAVVMATLVSAFESMGLGIIAKQDLTLEQYDVLMGPVISAFPELIVLEQDWTVVPMDEDIKSRPRVTYGLPPIDTRQPERTKNFRKFRRTEDLEEAVDEVSVDAAELMAALKPKEKKVEKVEVSKEDAFKAMLAKMKPAEPIKEVEVAAIENSKEQLQSVIPEDLGITSPNPNPPDTRLRSLKITTEEGKFRLKDPETGEYFGEQFNTPIEAIVWTAKNGMKVK